MNDNDEKKESIEFLIKSCDMFSEKDYDRLDKQVSGHRWFLGQKLGREVSWDEAATSWLENVYLPVSEAMEMPATQASFPGRARDDVFFELCDHWFFEAKDHDGKANAYNATLDYDEKYGSLIGRFLARRTGSEATA